MPKLYSSKHIIKVLERHGFFFVSQKGSHVKYRMAGKTILTVIVPHPKRETPYGTFRSILRQSGLAEIEFKDK